MTLLILLFAVGILLIIHEMVGRGDLERVAEDLGLGMGRGPETDDLGREDDRIVVFIMGQMINTGFDRHLLRCSLLFVFRFCAMQKGKATGKLTIG